MAPTTAASGKTLDRGGVRIGTEQAGDSAEGIGVAKHRGRAGDQHHQRDDEQRRLLHEHRPADLEQLESDPDIG
jgi:hypothetical protein